MADTVKSSQELLIECVFLDGDTRTITLRNPRTNIAESTVASLETYMQTENIIVGDRDGSDFRKIKKAYVRNMTTTYLDLS